MIQSKSDLKKYLKYEASKYGLKKASKGFVLGGAGRGAKLLFRYNWLLRKTEYFLNTNKKLRYTIYKLRLKRYSFRTGIHIPPNCFDIGLKIMHLGPILVNGNCKVGKDCSIHIMTSLVATNDKEAAPKLGDGVIIGVGSVLIGDIFINNNIVVGANSTVTKSFEEENIAIAGSPAVKISNNGRLNWSKK